MVLTVWDMIHEIFSDQMDPPGFVAQMKRKAIKAADAIICISENTRKDLLERYPEAEDKVSVTALAADINISLANGPEVVPSRPYYLYVGSRSFYKNFGGLSAALAKAVSARPEMALCVVGAPFNEMEQRLIADLKLTNHIEHYGYPTKEHLAKLYRQSIALVYPSLYEGFGLPPLEAMSCGTAVVASDVASIPEVVGEAGLLFDPQSPDALTDRLLLLFDSPAERNRLVAKGHERVRAFSWDKTAAETLQIYRSVSKRVV
jgi:glycosyltransferase involved in cell wall biosynthesis